MQLDANNRVIIPDLDKDRARYQLRVSLVTLDNDGNITATTQARNVTVTTLRAGVQFPAVTSLRLQQGTTATTEQIRLTWFASTVGEVYAHHGANGTGLAQNPYRLTTATGAALTNVTFEYGEPHSNGRILVTATILDHGLTGTGNRVIVQAVTAEGVESRIARTGSFRVQ